MVPWPTVPPHAKGAVMIAAKMAIIPIRVAVPTFLTMPSHVRHSAREREVLAPVILPICSIDTRPRIVHVCHDYLQLRHLSASGYCCARPRPRIRSHCTRSRFRSSMHLVMVNRPRTRASVPSKSAAVLARRRRLRATEAAWLGQCPVRRFRSLQGFGRNLAIAPPHWPNRR